MSKPSPCQSTIPDPTDLPIGWRWLGKSLIWILVNRNRRRTLRVERKRIPVLNDTIETVRHGLSKAREHGMIHTDRIFNVSLYLLLMERDFAVLKVEMVSTFEKWRLRFTARQAGLLLHEASVDLSNMLGKEFRNSLTFVGVTDAEMKELNEIASQLKRFKSRNQEFLYKEIRNLVVGHRAQDSLLFLETVENLDPMRVFRLGAKFYDIVRPLTEFLINAVLRSGETRSVFKQLLDSPQFMASLETKENTGHGH